MRPCNRCRQPIENARYYCDRCEAEQLAAGITPGPPVSLNPEVSSQTPERWWERIHPAMLMFALPMAICLGIVGYLLIGFQGVLAGIAIALVATLLVTSLMGGG